MRTGQHAFWEGLEHRRRYLWSTGHDVKHTFSTRGNAPVNISNVEAHLKVTGELFVAQRSLNSVAFEGVGLVVLQHQQQSTTS
jgi:hypothetical protein